MPNFWLEMDTVDKALLIIGVFAFLVFVLLVWYFCFDAVDTIKRLTRQEKALEKLSEEDKMRQRKEDSVKQFRFGRQPGTGAPPVNQRNGPCLDRIAKGKKAK
jgi:hypothetical protein